MIPAAQSRLNLVYKLAILAYVLSVVVFSYREGLTLLAKGWALVLVGLFVFRAFAAGEKAFFPNEFKLLLAWFLVGVVSSLLADDPGTTVVRIVTLLQVLPIAFVLSNFVYWNGDSRFYWICILLAGVVSGVVTVLSPGEFSGLDGRVYGTLANANAFGALLVVVTIICLAGMMLTRVVLMQVAMLLLAAFFVYLVGRTGSRMSMLATVAGIGVVFVCYQMTARARGVSRSLGILVVGIVVVVGAVTYLSESEFSGRLEALGDAAREGDFRGGDTSLSNRALLYVKAFEMFLEKPLVGGGLDTFKDAQLNVGARIGNNAHSNYMEILQSTGLVGFLIYFSIYREWFSRLIRARSLLRERTYAARYTTAAAIAVAFLVFDIAWVTYYEKLVWMVFAGLVAEVHLLARPTSALSQNTRRFPVVRWTDHGSS